jgi:hypothetical protein
VFYISVAVFAGLKYLKERWQHKFFPKYIVNCNSCVNDSVITVITTTTTTTISSSSYHHPLSLLNSSLAGSQKSTGLTDQAFLIHTSAKK